MTVVIENGDHDFIYLFARPIVSSVKQPPENLARCSMLLSPKPRSDFS